MGPIKIQNIIVASHLGKDVELIKLATELPNARYSSSGNPSVIVEMDAANDKKAAGVLFGNGKIIVTGVESLENGKDIISNLRNIIKEQDGSFYESDHLAGDNDMYEIIREILFEEKNRSKNGGRGIIPMRPDHGHLIGDEVYKKNINPGYSYGGRLKGLGELRGVIYTLEKLECH